MTGDHRYKAIDAHAERINAELRNMSRANTEHMNRRIGQITRYTLARIELARRESSAQ